MATIKIYVHAENDRDPRLLEVSEKPSRKEIIDIYLQEFPKGGPAEEIEVFIEDREGPIDKEGTGHGIEHRHHVHCHRCKKISTTVIYNGDHRNFHFPPSETSRQILRKATHAFGIKESDSNDYLLKLEDKTILQPSDHIGSFTIYPHCQVELFLTPTKPVQG